MPPKSLMRLKAVSMPSFIWRPSSLAEPEKGATMPKRISLALTPRTLPPDSGTAWVTVGVTAAMVAGGGDTAGAAGAGGAASAGGAAGAVGAGAAAADDGPITPASDGPASDCSRSASWRAANLQSVRPVVTALRPSVT